MMGFLLGYILGSGKTERIIKTYYVGDNYWKTKDDIGALIFLIIMSLIIIIIMKIAFENSKKEKKNKILDDEDSSGIPIDTVYF